MQMKMRVGLLESLNEAKGDAERMAELERAIHRAAKRFHERTLKQAHVVHVHPGTIEGLVPDGQVLKVGGMVVRKRRDVLRQHVWVGVEDE